MIESKTSKIIENNLVIKGNGQQFPLKKITESAVTSRPLDGLNG